MWQGVQYKPFGPIEQLSFGNGLVLNRTFDQAYRLTAETLGSTHSASYTPDAAGNITDIVDNVDATHTQAFGYDALNRLEDESGSYGDKSYVYDANGNRTSRSWDDGTQITTQSLAYEAASNRLDTRDAVNVSLDAAGNTLAQNDGSYTFTYSYNDAGRLREAYRDGQLKMTSSYDAYGRRVVKVKPSGSTEVTSVFLYAPDGRLLSETVLRSGWANPSAYREVIWLDEMPVAHLRRTFFSSGNLAVSQFTYLHADHLNTPRFGTDENQTVMWRNRTDAFGEGDVEPDPDGDGVSVWIQLRFPGQYSDGATGVFYNYFRDYEPGTGRYVESDPIGLDGGVNTYTYVRGNPATSVDVRGLFEVVVHDPCSNLSNFSAAVNCRRAFTKSPLGQRAAQLRRFGDRLDKAIGEETDCECKEELQNLFENWTVEPTLIDSPGNFPAATQLFVEGGQQFGLRRLGGTVTGGRTTFFNETWDFGRPFSVFLHEFAHMTPTVYSVPSNPLLDVDDPNEKAARRHTEFLQQALFNRSSLCP